MRVALSLLVAAALGACASSGSGDTESVTPPSGTTDVERTVVQGVESGGRAIALFARPDGTEREIGAGRDYVWAVMPAVFRQLEIPLAHADPRVFEIGNRGYRALRIEGDRLSKFFRCGQSMTGSRTNEYDITLSVITILLEGPDDTTLIRTTVDARGRQRATNAVNINCETSGALEERIAEVAQKLVADKIASGNNDGGE